MRYGACETFTGSDHAALERWRATSPVAVRASCNHRFCDLGESLYLLDRCWNNRFFCSIHMGNHTAPLVVGQADSTPAGTRLDPGRYLVALGPAATLGVASHTSFADTLRRQLQLPVVNLGRGGSGRLCARDDCRGAHAAAGKFSSCAHSVDGGTLIAKLSLWPSRVGNGARRRGGSARFDEPDACGAAAKRVSRRCFG